MGENDEDHTNNAQPKNIFLIKINHNLLSYLSLKTTVVLHVVHALKNTV